MLLSIPTRLLCTQASTRHSPADKPQPPSSTKPPRPGTTCAGCTGAAGAQGPAATLEWRGPRSTPAGAGQGLTQRAGLRRPPPAAHRPPGLLPRAGTPPPAASGAMGQASRVLGSPSLGQSRAGWGGRGRLGQEPARADALAGQHPEQRGKKRKGLLRRLRRGRRRGGQKGADRDHAALQRQQQQRQQQQHQQHQPEEADNRTLLRELRGLAGSLKRSFTTKRRRWGAQGAAIAGQAGSACRASWPRGCMQ